MQNRGNLSAEQHREMLAMLDQLTPEERASLADPNFITEDEADLIVSDRRSQENQRGIPFDEVLRLTGRTRRRIA